MKVSLAWIREYTPLPLELDPQEIADRLTLATVEVEQVIDLSASLTGVVVGRITEVVPHPNSDRLNLVTVDLGDTSQQVVCGGSNVAEDMMIAFAQSGSVVTGRDGAPFTLGKVTIRGVESEGMICAGQELGLAHLLPCSGKEISDLGEWGGRPGQALADLIGYHDHVLEIDNKSLTNRPDLWGHYGIARELAALYDLPISKLPDFETPSDRGVVEVTINDTDRCGRYTCTTINGVDARHAPTWMRSRLCRVGQRPINGLVDLTNYVMMATGQPSHAFDARDIQGGFQIRRAHTGEKMVLLDESDLTLSDDDLVIASGAPVALAGVMGGALGVREDTQDLVLEVASFSPVPIRRTARTYHLRTESSARFEKGLDTQRVDVALGLFIQLMSEIFPEAQVNGHLDIYPQPTPELHVQVSLAFIQRRLGIELSADQVTSSIQRLGFSVDVSEADEGQDSSTLTISVPAWRATGDVSLPEDIVEEVGRMYGYDRLDFSPPQVSLESAVIQPRRKLERRIKEHLAHTEGLQEVITYPWSQDRYLSAAGLDDAPCLELATPHAPELRRIRPALAPQLLETIVSNLRWFSNFGVFELGRVFLDRDYTHTPDSDEQLPSQRRHLAAARVGSDAVELFLTLKGTLERFARAVQCAPLTLCVSDQAPPWADPAGYLCICTQGQKIGGIGVLSARCKRLAGIKQTEAALFEIDVDLLEAHTSRENHYQPLPKYPEVDFDLAFIVNLATSWTEVHALIQSTHEMIRDVTFVENFMGSQIPAGHKSMMVRMRLGSDEGTLSREQIDEISQKVIVSLGDAFNAQLR